MENKDCELSENTKNTNELIYNEGFKDGIQVLFATYLFIVTVTVLAEYVIYDVGRQCCNIEFYMISGFIVGIIYMFFVFLHMRYIHQSSL